MEEIENLAIGAMVRSLKSRLGQALRENIVLRVRVRGGRGEREEIRTILEEILRGR